MSRPLRPVAGLAVATTALVAAVTLLRHHHFLSGAYDLGFYIHDVWMLGRGEWHSSILGFHVFADHFSPIMLLLAPLSWLGSTGVWLLLIQALAVGSGVLAAHRIGEKVGDESLGWLCAVWFASSAAIWHAVMFDFRPVTLGVIVMLWLIAALEEEWRLAGVVSLALLAASVREDVAVLAGIILVIHAVVRRRNTRTLITFGAGVASVGFAYTLGGSRLFAPFDYFLWYRFADYGASPLEALADPGYLIPTALSRLVRLDPLVAFAALLIPLLVLPAFIGWRRSWPAFLIMASNGISVHPAVPTIYYQYYLAAVVFLIWGAAYAFREEAWVRRRKLSAAVAVAVFVGLGPVMFVGYGLEERYMSGVITSGERSGLQELVEEVPPSASVSAGRLMLAHMAERREVYPFPGPMFCGSGIIFHIAATSYPEYVVIEHEEADQRGIALDQLGYTKVAEGRPGGEVWQSRGDHPPSEPCPTPGEARALQFQYVRDEASR